VIFVEIVQAFHEISWKQYVTGRTDKERTNEWDDGTAKRHIMPLLTLSGVEGINILCLLCQYSIWNLHPI